MWQCGRGFEKSFDRLLYLNPVDDVQQFCDEEVDAIEVDENHDQDHQILKAFAEIAENWAQHPINIEEFEDPVKMRRKREEYVQPPMQKQPKKKKGVSYGWSEKAEETMFNFLDLSTKYFKVLYKKIAFIWNMNINF